MAIFVCFVGWADFQQGKWRHQPIFVFSWKQCSVQTSRLEFTLSFSEERLTSTCDVFQAESIQWRHRAFGVGRKKKLGFFLDVKLYSTYAHIYTLHMDKSLELFILFPRMTDFWQQNIRKYLVIWDTGSLTAEGLCLILSSFIAIFMILLLE